MHTNYPLFHHVQREVLARHGFCLGGLQQLARVAHQAEFLVSTPFLSCEVPAQIGVPQGAQRSSQSLRVRDELLGQLLQGRVVVHYHLTQSRKITVTEQVIR